LLKGCPLFYTGTGYFLGINSIFEQFTFFELSGFFSLQYFFNLFYINDLPVFASFGTIFACSKN